MSKYSTGELARACGVTVRTVQYYDKRGILSPSELSEGGRRLYGEEDLKTLRLICFLRELGLSIETVANILAEPNSDKVLTTLLEQHALELEEDLAHQQEQLENTRQFIREIRTRSHYSLEQAGDIAHTMKGQKKLAQVRKQLMIPVLSIGLPLEAAFIVTLILTRTHGWWIPFVVAAALYAAFLVVAIALLVPRYFRQIAYLCPECHHTFKPAFSQFFWASHTPRTRKLTCPSCGKKSFCVEVCDPEAAEK